MNTWQLGTARSSAVFSAIWTPAVGVAEWPRIVNVLLHSGPLQDVQPATVGVYVISWLRWLECEAFIEKNGAFIYIRDDKGVLKKVLPAPQVGLSQKMVAQMRQFWLDCGLTPQSQKRLLPDGDGRTLNAITAEVRSGSASEDRKREIFEGIARIG